MLLNESLTCELCRAPTDVAGVCVVLWSSNEREASGRQARRAAEHTENDSSNSGKPDYK